MWASRTLIHRENERSGCVVLSGACLQSCGWFVFVSNNFLYMARKIMWLLVDKHDLYVPIFRRWNEIPRAGFVFSCHVPVLSKVDVFLPLFLHSICFCSNCAARKKIRYFSTEGGYQHQRPKSLFLTENKRNATVLEFAIPKCSIPASNHPWARKSTRKNDLLFHISCVFLVHAWQCL